MTVSTRGQNPFANLRLEQSRGRKDLVALTEDELHELGDTAARVLGDYGPTFRSMILFAGYVGLRPGELFALERGDLLSWLFVTGRGRQFRKSSLLYYWNPVRAAFGRPGMDFYELRHFCATHLLELGVSHADVAVQLGHTDGGALVMSTYGHPSEDGARERLKRAYKTNVVQLAAEKAQAKLDVRGGIQ